MTLRLIPLSPEFAAEAGGLDLSRPVDDDTVAAIRQAIDRYAVLVVRDQRLSDAALRDFAARFGPLEIGRSAARPAGGASRFRRSATSPTWTRITGSAT